MTTTEIIKSYHGTQVKTFFKKSDIEQYEILTMKGYSGTVFTSATRQDIRNNTITFEPFKDITHLLNEKIRATKNNLLDQHKRGIEAFKNLNLI